MNTMLLALMHDRLSRRADQLHHRLGVGEAAGRAGDGAVDELQQVRQALQLLHQGRYGLCVDCGASMEVDQLLLKPHRLLCSSCEPTSRSVRRSRPALHAVPTASSTSSSSR